MIPKLSEKRQSVIVGDEIKRKGVAGVWDARKRMKLMS